MALRDVDATKGMGPRAAVMGDMVDAGTTDAPCGLALAPCDIVLIKPLAKAKVRARLLDRVAGQPRAPVLDVPPDAVTQGGLMAPCCHAQGHPVFFDFLPTLSSVELKQGIWVNFDLVRPSNAMRAELLYKSSKPA